MVTEQNRATSSWVDCRHAFATKWPVILLTVSLLLLLGSFLGSREGPVFESVTEVSLLGEDAEEFDPRAATELRPSALNSYRRREASLRSGALLLQVVDSHRLVERWDVVDRVGALKALRAITRIKEVDERGGYQIAVRSSSREEATELSNAIALDFIAREKSKARAEAESLVRSFAAEIESRSEMINSIEMELRSLNSGDQNSKSANEAKSRDLRRRLVSVSNIIRSLEAKHQRSIVELQSVTPGVTLAKKAGEEEAARVQRHWHRAGLFCLIGFLGSSAVVLLFSSGRSPFGVISRITEKFQMGVVGVAPVAPLSLLRLNRPPDSVLEPYRDLRTKIRRLPAAECSVISLVPESTSSDPSQVAVNLSAVLADAGHMVLLIDGDLRESRVAPLVEAAQQPGLSDFLKGEMRLEESVVKTRHANLWCIPSGPMVNDPGSLLGGKRMDDLIWEMKSRFEYILITSPSTQTHSDAGVLAGHSDHVFIVSDYQSHSFSKLKKVHFALEESEACVSGVLLTYSTGVGEKPSNSQRRTHHTPSAVQREEAAQPAVARKRSKTRVKKKAWIPIA